MKVLYVGPDYLYNQDVVTADVIINSEIHDHFRLKASFLKSLNAVYKDAGKAYQASKNAKRAKAGTAIPDWYEPNDKGLCFLPGVLAKKLSDEQKVFYAAEQWRLLVQKDIRELNANPYIINVRNGLYNVLEDTLTEHTPEYCSTVQLNVTYDKTADCPLFKQFLADSMGGDMEQVSLIQEMLGYFLIPVNSAQKCFVIVGAAGAGKSVLLRVLNDVLLGKQNMSNVSWQALNERFKTAELFGKLANIFADLHTKNIDNNGIFKALVDYFTVTKDGALEFDDRADSEEIENLLEQLAERGFTAADSGEEETAEEVSENADAEPQGESVGCGLPVATSCEARSTDRVGRRDNRVDEAGAETANRTWRSAGSAMEYGQHFHPY